MESLDDIFLAARALADPGERAAYLAHACGPNAALRASVEAMLRDAAQAEAFFNGSENRMAPTVAAPVTEKPGDRIGRYKLLQQIGEGGGGVVYMAEQEEPVRRRVALKVIKLGMDTKNVIARFEAERQALALMDHPNIAKVLDAGATESGRPYFVMELVRGIKLTDYCDQNNLPTRERLDLFIQVCHAIQHAHQKGIIHRDIKPSNILVTLHDGVPVPKVIDFGIAKAITGQRLTDKTLFTAYELFIGTPAYMSPEQAEMSGLDIDTRSDVYGLGVLLYELLTGKTPFDPKTLLAAGLDEMRRIIREQEVVRPSTRLSTMLEAERTQVAKHREADPPSLIHSLRGDLDWIVMKCLEKDRGRRYETANGLAQDIQRHLSHEPVMARSPSAAYRIQKFVRRNKVMVTAGAAVVAALVLGTAVSTWQAVRASHQRARAEANEEKARQAQENEVKQRRAAQRAQRQAEAEELLARQNAYAADVNIADTAWRENNLGQALTALRRQIPSPGEADLRGIEWRYLWQKCQGQQSATFKHDATVTCAELSPDGRWLATESGSTFWVWDTARQGERRVLSPGAPAYEQAEAGHLAFDPRGHFLATATSSNVLIWSLTDSREPLSLLATNASLCFSGDGTTLATFGAEGIQVWKIPTCERLVRPGEIELAYNGVRRIALNRDGSLLAASAGTGGGVRVVSYIDGEVALWNVPQRQLLFKEREVKDAQKLALSDDDHWLAACTFGPPATVWLWSVPEGRLVAQWRASEGLARALAFAPGGRSLAVAGSDQVIRVWEIGQTNRPPELLRGHLNDVCSLKFAADGRLVSASSDKTVRLWNIGQSRSSQSAFSLPPGRLICPPTVDVRRIASVNVADLTFEEWDMVTGERLRRTSIQGADAILHHGTLFNGKSLTHGIVRYQFVFDVGVAPGVGRMRELFIAPFIPCSVSGSPGWDLRAQTGDGHFYVWSAESGELVYSNKVASRLFGTRPTVDHKKLVLLEEWAWFSSYLETRIYSYDLQTHQKELLEEHVMISPTGMPISTDGRLFACVTTNGWVKVWNLATKQSRSVVKLPAFTYAQLAFSSDSRWLAVATAQADGRAQVWNVGTGRPVSDALAGHLSGTYKVSFSADSKSLVTYSLDYTAKIWNIATGREMVSGLPLNRFLTIHPDSMLLPQDGNSVIESAGEAAIRVVRLPTLAQIDALEKGQLKQP